ncbi:hypothetical protein KHS38_10580 [Mucilaginibacter sp. Bleaf8]|uniref:hypothetical protein n=1 Tax=Mucilaginibacter sp. Bleaf8 TaxID=2834430 RepID=UPI001BCDBDD6|nr:hypothetical protein [Mucilaginibacter sp. Bleaf8]MBS7564850.1 hypothetical protein [Mucilaginibacter sp. Bleaf8]
MNAFYERLSHFGELIGNVSQQEEKDIASYFTVQHPGFPVVSSTQSIVPKLTFMQNCPAEVRKKVRYLLKKSFNRIRNKV